MPNPVSKTFELLATTRNEAAVSVLVAALDSSDETVRSAAVRALINRPSTKGRIELIRRFRDLPDSVMEAFRGRSADFEAALGQSLTHGDPALRLNAVEVVRLTENFSHIKNLVIMLEEAEPELLIAGEGVIRELVSRLYEHQQFGKSESGSDVYIRNVPQTIHNILVSFDSACEKFHLIRRPEVLLESILILGDSKNFAVKKVLWQSSPECKELAGQILQTSRHPGVIALLISQLNEKHPHPKALNAIEVRDDPDMVFELLRSIPKRLSTAQQKNHRQLEEICWLDPEHPLLKVIPAGLQPNLVTFLASTGLLNDKKAAIQQWLLRNGSAEGRNAAAGSISQMDGDELKAIVLEGLESNDETIQAWATSQLRNSHVPDAIQKLVERLDDSDDLVREAARNELKSFDLERLLDVSENLSPEVCVRAGEILLKINPDTIHDLARQLASPIRSHRLRAAKAVHRMQLQDQLLPGIIAMLDDTEVHMRRTALEILGDSPNVQAAAAIQNCLGDPNPRVSDAAKKALEALKTRIAADGERSGNSEVTV